MCEHFMDLGSQSWTYKFYTGHKNPPFSQTQQNDCNFWTTVQFWFPSILKISLYHVRKYVFDWKHHLYPLRLGGDVENWYEHIWGLTMFVQKTQIKGDCFTAYYDGGQKKCYHLGKIVWFKQFFLCSKSFFLFLLNLTQSPNWHCQLF